MVGGRGLWRKSQRMLRPQQFATLVAARPAWHSSRGWLSMSALLIEDDRARLPTDAAKLVALVGELPRVQIGLTIPKRLCRRAVMRNLVKRLLRESSRVAYDGIAGLVPERLRLDLMFKLRAPLPGRDLRALADLKTALAGSSEELWSALASALRSGRVPIRREDVVLEPGVSGSLAGQGMASSERR